MRTLVLFVLATTGLAASISAQQPVILSFEPDGMLTWSNAYSNAVASIERLTDVVTTGSVVTVTETLGVSDGSTDYYSYTVEHPPIINPSVTIDDGTYSWNDETGYSTNPPVFIGWAEYSAGTIHADYGYGLQVPTAGTTIQVEYAYLPVSTTQEWHGVYVGQPISQVSQASVEMGEDLGLFRIVNWPLLMVLIPAGSNSGTNPLAPGESHNSCSYPATYSLSVASFYMDRFEVTNDEMVDVMQWAYDHSPPLITVSASTVQNAQGNQQELLNLDDAECRITWNGAVFGMKTAKGSGYPCVEVSWYGAAVYCNYRSEMEGRPPCYDLSDWSCNLSAGGYRLPTSEEWEYAARGGAVSRRFPWGGDTISHGQANYYSENFPDYDLSSVGYHPSYKTGGHPYTSPVGSFDPNAYGLYDMAGNVWEWCSDWHPCHVGSDRVFRGGGYYGFPPYCRVGYRDYASPDGTMDGVGFRTVLPGQ